MEISASRKIPWPMEEHQGGKKKGGGLRNGKMNYHVLQDLLVRTKKKTKKRVNGKKPFLTHYLGRYIGRYLPNQPHAFPTSGKPTNSPHQQSADKNSTKNHRSRHTGNTCTGNHNTGCARGIRRP